ncbi:MAG: hypothetical protein BMS9Abin12_0861 [Acidimicrobiia bacterium]|nr:MAG: hypothetical protein BMS9Abin12_0861 [Acidimicrobiia bacterium]
MSGVIRPMFGMGGTGGSGLGLMECMVWHRCSDYGETIMVGAVFVRFVSFSGEEAHSATRTASVVRALSDDRIGGHCAPIEEALTERYDTLPTPPRGDDYLRSAAPKIGTFSMPSRKRRPLSSIWPFA